ncbi:ABC-F family ATP-binding cassette domain-containing protein [Planctomycetota bacterium]|nr:ABC-F family ATP-binding cassette domain-containing protein [Planctomycetota bacterium]
MALVTLSSVHKHFGGPVLLRDVSLAIDRGHKIGLIGQNGTGKSTLLKLILGHIEPADGEIHRQRNLKVAYQAQELKYDAGSTVLDEMRKLFADDFARLGKLNAIEEKMSAGQSDDRTLADYDRLQQEHHTAGGYEVDHRIETVLTGLGLPKKSWSQPIESFSGGERNIIGLAKILLQKPDLMLLDEPSNHLDMAGIEWFIQFIRRTDAAVLMVSHNRHLLDATATEIWELHGRRVTRWAGNYSDFQREKAEKLALQERQYKAQQRWIKRIEFQARRLKDMASAYDDPGQAKRAKAMLQRIDQLDKIDKPDKSENRFHASLAGGGRHGHIALSVEDLTIKVADRTLLDGTSLEIQFGERVALVGPNGSGKTTLFNAILRHADWDHPDVEVQEGPFWIAGKIRTGKSATIGDYSQIHQQTLDESRPLVDWFSETTGLHFQPASELLHRFLFSRNDLNRQIGTLSGGEKSRLQLARLVHEKVNFLMLDEPTNHLDIQACEQLEEMLEEFPGTLLIISHDRYFLDKLVKRVVDLQDKKLVVHEGDFAGWFNEKMVQVTAGPRKSLQLHSQKEAAGDGEAKQSREERKAQQRRQHQLKTQLKQIESRIEKLEALKTDLEKELAEAFSSMGADKALEVNQRFEEAALDLSTAYEKWEEVSTELDD